MARVIFVNRFYWPDEPATAQLLTDLAETLARHGHEVRVITSLAPASKTARTEQRQGVSIRPIRGTRWRRAGVLGQACDFASFLLGAFWHLLRAARSDTLVVLLTDPPLLGVMGGLAAAVKGARAVHWVQDIYPEIAMEVGGQRWLGMLRPLRDLAWRRGVAGVTLGDAMATHLRRAGVPEHRIHVIPNWAPAGVAPPLASAVRQLRREWNVEDRFVVAYSGNLGRVHDLAPLLDVAAAVQAAREIVFLFIGTGPQRAALEASARSRGLSNVVFLGPRPRHELAISLGAADLQLVTLRAGCESLVFPSKVYGIAAAGRPMLFVGPADCEVARLVRTHQLGLTFTRDDAAAMAQALRNFARDPSALAPYAAAAARFAGGHTAAIAAQRWLSLLDALDPCERCPPPGMRVPAR